MLNQKALRPGAGAAWLQPGFVKFARKRGLIWPPSKRIDVSAEVKTEHFFIPKREGIQKLSYPVDENKKLPDGFLFC